MMVCILSNIVQIWCRMEAYQYEQVRAEQTPPFTIVLASSSDALLRVHGSLELAKVCIGIRSSKE